MRKESHSKRGAGHGLEQERSKAMVARVSLFEAELIFRRFYILRGSSCSAPAMYQGKMDPRLLVANTSIIETKRKELKGKKDHDPQESFNLPNKSLPKKKISSTNSPCLQTRQIFQSLLEHFHRAAWRMFGFASAERAASRGCKKLVCLG